MHRTVCIASFAALLLFSVAPSFGHDLTFTVRKGQIVTMGPWYHMVYPYPPCRMVEVPRIVTMTKPEHGSVDTQQSRGKPASPQQIKSCPNLTLTRINAIYKADQAGTEKFSFMIEYNPPIQGDWIYNVTVQVVE